MFVYVDDILLKRSGWSSSTGEPYELTDENQQHSGMTKTVDCGPQGYLIGKHRTSSYSHLDGYIDEFMIIRGIEEE